MTKGRPTIHYAQAPVFIFIRVSPGYDPVTPAGCSCLPLPAPGA